MMEWIKTQKQNPPFDETVLCFCPIWGRYLAVFLKVGEFGGEEFGNWTNFNGDIGILPPTFWAKLPEDPTG